MLRNVFLKTLRETRRALLWWSLGLVGMTAMIVAIFPTVRDNPELNRLVEVYPEALKAFIAFGGELDYASGAGYLGIELFSFMVPLLLLIAAIGAGARAVAGEEENGTLDLLLANPISRRRLAVEKLAALASEIAVLGLVLWLSLLVGVAAVGMDVSAARLGAATASAALLALGFGAIALLVGAATGRRGVATGVAAAGAVAAYLVDSLAALVDFLEPVQRASPFYHYAASDPLRHGLSLGHAGVLVLLCGAAAVLAPLALERRDLRA
ncbi:MAG TPA: ABC transporter permease subunit [Planctomycetota bacterium]|nr:ABC transporter permease subunit [Planctomycetota bacterium]